MREGQKQNVVSEEVRPMQRWEVARGARAPAPANAVASDESLRGARKKEEDELLRKEKLSRLISVLVIMGPAIL